MKTRTLHLNFAKSKHLDPRITFKRNSIGTYYDASGVLRIAPVGAPRFDHNPVTGECLGLLHEVGNTNQVLYSQKFDEPSWTTSGVSPSATFIEAPDGSLTGCKLIEASTSTPIDHALYSTNAVGVTLGVPFTVSVYAKAGERDRIALGFYERSNVYATVLFNLTTGTAYDTIAPNATLVSYRIDDVGKGWYRLQVTSSHTVSAVAKFHLFVCNEAANVAYPQTGVSYTGDGASGLYVWGAQLEAAPLLSNFASSYIPTTSSPVTRDNEYVDLLFDKFTSWYTTGNEGTFFVDFDVIGEFGNANGSSPYSMGTDSNDVFATWFSWDNRTTVTITLPNLGTWTPGGLSYIDLTSKRLKIATAYTHSIGTVLSTSTCTSAIDGVIPPPAVDYHAGSNGQLSNTTSGKYDRFAIGRQYRSISYYGVMCGHIRQLSYWNKRLTDTELIEVTS